jgi:O-antigen ligase
MVALAVSINGRVAALSGVIALTTMVISVMTGERINFLIRACGGMLAGLLWKPKMGRYLALVATEIFAIVLVFYAVPNMASRYTHEIITGATDLDNSSWLQTMNGGWQIGQQNLLVGVGTANYRLVSKEGSLDDHVGTRPDVHPHNYYVQIFAETGVIGLLFGVIFLSSIVWTAFKESMRNRDNVFVATAWIIPFGIFWPIATGADFFGQWNNVFVWSSVALALSTKAASSA